MINLKKYSFFTLLLLLTSKAFAVGFYLGPGLAKSRYLSDPLKSYGTHASGHGYSFHAGYRVPQMAAEIFYHRLVTETDPMQFRGDQRYHLHAKSDSYGALGKMYLRNYNFRLGYAFHHFIRTLKPDTSGPEIEDPILENEFGVHETSKQGGMLFGVGMDFPLANVIPYFAATSFQLSNSNSSFIEFEFGLNIKL